MHANIVHPDPVLTKVRPAQASMQPNLKVCEEILPMTRHLCTQAHNLKHRCAPNWRWGAQPAGRASRDLHAEDWHVRCSHASAVCGERCGWRSASGRHFAFGIDRTAVVLTVSRS